MYHYYSHLIKLHLQFQGEKGNRRACLFNQARSFGSQAFVLTAQCQLWNSQELSKGMVIKNLLGCLKGSKYNQRNLMGKKAGDCCILEITKPGLGIPQVRAKTMIPCPVPPPRVTALFKIMAVDSCSRACETPDMVPGMLAYVCWMGWKNI